ncbi:efflux RND transporter periplasmic adaptor subunit [Hugenholtzia roseola]|uniref:efflux RND transporter periplasmic adaptor subunit n=1 Tax=Hugenholtzia roseola TaxID=1002 RepID=UPI00047E8189|nr:efflux RND transporter periplasmic adaptor subunit [Hugenholtzia roseola]
MINNDNLRKGLIVSLSLVVLVGGGYALMNYLGGLKKPQEQRKPVAAKIFVQTRKVSPAEVQTQIVTYGRVESAKPVDVVAEVSGRLLAGSIPLQVGQKVRAGQLLFSINKQEALLSLQAQKSNFIRDIALMLPDLKIDYNESFEAWQSYFQNLSVEKPLPEPPQAKNNKEKTFIAAKGINSSYYNIKSQEAQLEKYAVAAPFDAIISEVYMQAGSSANPGAKVVRLLRSDELELRVPIEVSDVNWIKLGTTVAVSSEDRQKEWQGKIVRISEIVNPATQSLDAFVAITNNKESIYDGMYLRAKMQGAKVEEAIEIPRRALFNENQVYIVWQDSVLKNQTVQIHKLNPETAVISGLAPNSDLVIEPLINAFDNMRVSKIEAQNPEKKAQGTTSAVQSAQ